MDARVTLGRTRAASSRNELNRTREKETEDTGKEGRLRSPHANRR